jgi:hypothetical protein
LAGECFGPDQPGPVMTYFCALPPVAREPGGLGGPAGHERLAGPQTGPGRRS